MNALSRAADADRLLPVEPVAFAPAVLEPRADGAEVSGTLVLACAPALPGRITQAGGDILRAPYMRQVTRPLALRIWSGSWVRPIVDPPGGRQFERYDMMIEAAIDGHGTGVFPEVLVRRELRLGQLVLAHPHIATPTAAYYVVTPENREVRPEVDALRRWLIESARSPP